MEGEGEFRYGKGYTVVGSAEGGCVVYCKALVGNYVPFIFGVEGFDVREWDVLVLILAVFLV